MTCIREPSILPHHSHVLSKRQEKHFTATRVRLQNYIPALLAIHLTIFRRLTFDMSIIRYLRLKVCAIFVRLLFRLQFGRLLPSPTSVLYLPSRDLGQRSIKVNIYRPSAPGSEPTPVLINFCGSGFIVPLHGSDDLFCRRVVDETQYTVLDVEYRLAPEHPWPAAHHDAEDVINWVLQRPKQFDLSRIALSGFSAGAQMACVASAVTFPRETFSTLLLFYPPADLSVPPSEKHAPDTSGKPMPKWLLDIFLECYLPQGQDPTDPSVSPLFAPMENFPRDVLVVTAAGDNLCLEGESLCSRIRDRSDRHVVHYRAEGCDHAWDKQVQSGRKQEGARDHAYALAVTLLQR